MTLLRITLDLRLLHPGSTDSALDCWRIIGPVVWRVNRTCHFHCI